MNTTFIERSLPPSDRPEIPPAPPVDRSTVDHLSGERSEGLQNAEDLFAGQDDRAPTSRGGADRAEFLPGLMLVIEQCGPALDEAQMALGDLRLAQTQNNLALFKSSARRLADLTHHVARTAKNYRASENTKLQPKE